MVLPNETLVDVFSHFGFRALVIVQLSNSTFDSVIQASKEHLAQARRYRLECLEDLVRLHQVDDAWAIGTIGGPIYECDREDVSMAESLQRVKALLDATEAENDAHPIVYALFSYASWSSAASQLLMSYLPSLEHTEQLVLACQATYEFPATDWSLVDGFVKPFAGLRRLSLLVFDGTVDWKFLRGESIRKLHLVCVDNCSSPEDSTIDHGAEDEIFRYCFDNTRLRDLDEPLVSKFEDWELSPEFIGRVIKKAESVPFKVRISLTANADAPLDKERFVETSFSHRCVDCGTFGVGQCPSGPHLWHRYTSRRSSLVVLVDDNEITIRN